jgi:putative glycosyltransferase (TIGR04372 family)
MRRRLNRGLLNLARRAYANATCRRLLAYGLRTAPGRFAALLLIEQLRDVVTRRTAVEVIQRLNATRSARDRFATAARRRHTARPDNIVRFDILAVALLHSEDPQQAKAILTCPQADEILHTDVVTTSILGGRISLGHEMEHYRAVMDDARRGTDQAPEALRARGDYLKCAFAAGKLLLGRDAIEFVGRQYMIVPDHPGHATNCEIHRVIDTIIRKTLCHLREALDLTRIRARGEQRIGVFFLSSTEALGHAVLDPYHFIALNRNQFDEFIFIGPPRSSYRPASRACLQIVETYGDYIETESDLLNNLSWMSLGHHKAGKITLIIDHYWSLIRAAVHRSRDLADGFRHNAWHFALPPDYTTFGELFCSEHGIDLARPLIVLHVRDSGYHGIERQSFRDSSIVTYGDAIADLLANGYQVVRIGDTSMPQLDIGMAGYFELPFLPDYRHELDPFLISRACFMIGCQSGPCAFARALGVPLLTVNAVLHYTLLPSIQEMACFKRYYRLQDGLRTELSLSDALDARADQLDNGYRLADAGLVVENASSEEIVAAVRDMVAWIRNSDLSVTPEQACFRARVEAQAVALAAERDTLPLPIADYIGICLDGYRVSPTVEAMRQGSPNRGSGHGNPSVYPGTDIISEQAAR